MCVEVGFVPEEPAALADEVHRMTRMMSERQTETQVAGGGPQIASRDVPEADARADEGAADVPVDFDVDEPRPLIRGIAIEEEHRAQAERAADFPLRFELL